MKTSVRSIVAACVTGLLVAVTPVKVTLAQGVKAGDVKIAIIDIEYIERNSVAWKSLSEQINARRAQLQNEVQSMQNAFQEKAQELESQRSLLSSEAFNSKAQELQKERARLQRETNSRKKELDKAYGSARKQIRKGLHTALLEVKQEKSISLVLNSGRNGSVYLADAEFSVNDIVLKRLNEKIQTVELPAQNSSN